MSTPKLPIFLAPLQGYTEAAYRNAHALAFGGVTSYYTPFVRYEKEEFRNKDVRDIAQANNRVPHLTVQLLANNPAKAEAIIALFGEHNYQRVDINLGCPFPMLAKRGCGSGILPHPHDVQQLLQVVEQHPNMEFSVKMRLGWESPKECIALAPILNELPLKHITMHPRLGKQQYKGTVDLAALSDFADVCQHPLVYNGDLTTTEDITRIHRMFPQLSGVMIGRGLLSNPALALEYETGCKLSEQEMRQRLYTLHQEVLSQYEKQIEGGEAQLLNKLKTFWEYLQPIIGSKPAKQIKKSKTMDSYQEAIRAVR